MSGPSGGLLERLGAIWGEVERGGEQLDAQSCYLSPGSTAPSVSQRVTEGAEQSRDVSQIHSPKLSHSVTQHPQTHSMALLKVEQRDSSIKT